MSESSGKKRSLETDQNNSETTKKPALNALEKARALAAKITENVISLPQSLNTTVTSNQETNNSNFSHGLNNFERQVFFPFERFPGTNFVGLILGPKAMTLKELQTTLNCSITIRGQGLGQKIGQANLQHNDEPQHVFIQASSEQIADNAYHYISTLVNDESKQQELKARQKALLNQGAVGMIQPSFQQAPTVLGNMGMQYGVQQPQAQFQPQTMYQGSATIGGGSQVTKHVKVPQELAGALIGRGGDQIRQFIGASGAHIQIDNSPQAQSLPPGSLRDMIVTGTADQVQRGEEVILDFVRRKQMLGSDTNTALQFPCQLRIEVPNNKVGLIIGKQGKTVHRIQEQYGCKIDIPVSHDEGNPDVRTLTIGCHTNEGLEAAKNDIIQVISYQMPSDGVNSMSSFQMQSAMAMSNQFLQQVQAQTQIQSVKMSIPEELVPMVNEHLVSQVLQTKSGCNIQMNPYADKDSDPPTRSVIISGTTEGVNIAVADLTSLVQNQQQTQPEKEAEAQNGSSEPKQKYTKEQWLAWKEYYKQAGYEIADEPPEDMKADNYDG